MMAITTSSFDTDNPAIQRLADAGWPIVRNPFGRKMSEGEVLDLLESSDAEAMIAGVEPLTRAVFDANPQLRMISRCGSGVDQVDVAAAEELGIAVYRTPETPAEAVAELTIALAIAVLRRIGEADRLIRSGEWQALMGRSYGKSRIGIVGLGHVGSRVAKVSVALGAEVGYTDHFVDDDDLPTIRDRRGSGTVGRRADHSPPARRGDASHGRSPILDALGPGGVVVNTARGGLVDEEALFDALCEGRIAGAALDVYESEPYSGPLTTLPNVMLTCHMGSYARQVRAAMESEALRNALAHLGLA